MELVGKGTFSLIYKININGIDYAKKVLRPNESPELLKNERNYLRLLEGTYVPKIINSNDNSITMPYYPKTLENYDGSNVNEILKRLLQVLDKCHRDLGVNHGDIKPSNVLMDEKDNAYLADWGLAGPVDLHEYDPSSYYALLYRSPELLVQLSTAGTKADIWSLGAIAYELLYGRKLAVGTTEEEVLTNLLDKVGKPPTYSSLWESPIKKHRAIMKQANSDSERDGWIPILKDMLEPDPFLRLSAQQLLKKYFC